MRFRYIDMGKWWVSEEGKRGTTLTLVVQSLSCVQLLATSWTAACQASLSLTTSRSLLKLMSLHTYIIWC